MRISVVILSVAVLTLTGCANKLAWYGTMQDRADPCQTRAELNRPQGYQAPDWCGSARAQYRIYNTQGRLVGTIR